MFGAARQRFGCGRVDARHAGLVGKLLADAGHHLVECRDPLHRFGGTLCEMGITAGVISDWQRWQLEASLTVKWGL